VPDLATTPRILVVGSVKVTAVPERVGTTMVACAPLAILILTDVPLTAKVLPVPTKFSVLTGPDVIEVPADEIPRLNPSVAVTIPAFTFLPLSITISLLILIAIFIYTWRFLLIYD